MFFWPMTTVLVMLIQQIECKKIYLKGNVMCQLPKKIKKLQSHAASKMLTMCPLHVHTHTKTRHIMVMLCSEVMLSSPFKGSQVYKGVN